LRIFNQTVTASKPGGVNTPAIVTTPSFVYLTLVAVGSAAATCKIEKTYSTGDLSTATWVSVNASLDAVGTTPVAYDLTAELEMQSFEDHTELLQSLAQCEASGIWPAYGSGILELDFPAWAKRSGEVDVSFVEN
jgi:4-hydroxy-L-threonine phosphate dehydrogenase PdxA